MWATIPAASLSVALCPSAESVVSAIAVLWTTGNALSLSVASPGYQSQSMTTVMLKCALVAVVSLVLLGSPDRRNHVAARPQDLQSAELPPADAEESVAEEEQRIGSWLDELDKELMAKINRDQVAAWNYEANLTDYNLQVMNNLSVTNAEYYKASEVVIERVG